MFDQTRSVQHVDVFSDSVSVSPRDIQRSSHVDAVSVELLQRTPSADSATTRLQLRCNNPRPLSDLGYHPACQLYELSKYQPLPAVISDSWADKSLASSQQIAKETMSVDSIDSGFITSDSPVLSEKHKTVEELEVVLQLFDRSMVLVWLEQTKRSVTDISDWCAEEENFIRLAHFWLSEFLSDHRCSMFEFQYGLLRDKIASGCRSKKPSPEQLSSFLTAVLHEFPEGRLNGLAAAYTFLEHLEALAEKLKRDNLLATVTYSLHNQQNYDCFLAVRSYAIVTIWSAVLDQYRSGVDSVMMSSKKKSTRPSTAHGRSIRPSSACTQSARSRRSSTGNFKSELKSLDEEMAADADVSSQKRMFDAIRLLKFCTLLGVYSMFAGIQHCI